MIAPSKQPPQPKTYPQQQQQSLKYFTAILYVNPNKLQTIKDELIHFKAIFGEEKFIHFNDAESVKEYVQQRDDDNYLVMCNSRVIQQVYTSVWKCLNIYTKLLVFCGSYQRCTQVLAQNKAIVCFAQCYQQQLQSRIHQIQSQLLTNLTLHSSYKIALIFPTLNQQQSVQNQQSYTLKQFKYELGMQIKLMLLDRLQGWLKYIKQMDPNLKILLVFNNRKNQVYGYYKRIEKFMQEFKNISNVLLICSSKTVSVKEEQHIIMEESQQKMYRKFIQNNGQVTQFGQLQAFVTSIIL